jgi:hypothetical protein
MQALNERENMDHSLFLGLFSYISIVILATFICMGKILAILKTIDEKTWESMGKPVINLSLNPRDIDIRLPKNMAIVQFVWVFSTPKWAIENLGLSKLFIIYRLLSVLNLIGASGVLYLNFGLIGSA